MRNYTNIGVQFMPVVLVMAAVAFYALGSAVYTTTCMILAFVFFLVLSSEKFRKDGEE